MPEIPQHTNPDDVLGISQYEKGYYFLYYIELLMGESKILEFIRNYLKTREGGNITTKEFADEICEFIQSNFEQSKATEILEKIDFNTWFYDGDLPPVIHDSDFEDYDKMESVFQQYVEGKQPENLEILKSNIGLMIAFCSEIMINEDKFDAEKLAKIDQDLGISQIKNCEVLVSWYHAAMILGYTVIFDDIYDFLSKVGRMKFVLPIYRAIIEKDKPKAEELYAKNKSFYHPICKLLVEKSLS